MIRSSFGFRALLAPALALVLALGVVSGAGAKKSKVPVEPETGWGDEVLAGLEWRLVGPYRGGRSAAVAGIPGAAQRLLLRRHRRRRVEDRPTAARAGRTSPTASSAARSAPSRSPSGTPTWSTSAAARRRCAATSRTATASGSRPTPARPGATSACADSRHVPRIRIHPRTPTWSTPRSSATSSAPTTSAASTAPTTAARPGSASSSSPTTPARSTWRWTRPTRAILYASFWRVRRTPYSLESGGEGSGLWKSTDGGDTWTELTGNEGLPAGHLGHQRHHRLAVQPARTSTPSSRPRRAASSARATAARPGSKVNDERKLRQRAWYYTRIYADPADEDSGLRAQRALPPLEGRRQDLQRDRDAARRQPRPVDRPGRPAADDRRPTTAAPTSASTAARPGRPRATSRRRRSTGSRPTTPSPTACSAASRTTRAVRIRSAPPSAARSALRDWEPTAGGESGHIVAKPDDPDIVYGGSYGGFLTRVDHRTGERRAVNVWPDNPMGWGAAELEVPLPVELPASSSRRTIPNVLYAAANVLFKTTRRGRQLGGDQPAT